MSNFRKWGRTRIASVLCAGAMALGLSVGIAAPSSAALVSGCSVSPGTPWTNGVTAYGKTTTGCTGGRAYADFANSRVQEGVGLLGWNSGVWYYNNPSSPVVSVSVTAAYACNGHGTDTYRTNGKGGDIYGNVQTVYGSKHSLTC